MQTVKAPTYPVIYSKPGIFLAGGITGCPEWQSEVVEHLSHVGNGTLFNPRRDEFDVSNPSLTEEQIKWEFSFLWGSEIVVFWFCKETLCPITLYELGSHLTRSRLAKKPPQICIGIEDGYMRAEDIKIQAKFLAPDIKIVHDLTSIAEFIQEKVDHYYAPEKTE
jgi:hypothetical protein